MSFEGTFEKRKFKKDVKGECMKRNLKMNFEKRNAKGNFKGFFRNRIMDIWNLFYMLIV